MDQSKDASCGDLFPASLKLQTNDFPIDLTNAQIHKYTIKFSPKTIPRKEKRFLARRFVSQIMLSREGEAFIYDDKFEILLPSIESHLCNQMLKAVYFLKNEIADGVTSPLECSSHGIKVKPIFLTDSLSTREDKIIPLGSKATTEEGALQICVVFADMVTVDTRLLESRLTPSDADGSVVQEQRQVIHALNKVLLREAHDTSSVYVDGNRLFDLQAEPIAAGEAIELRSGVMAETCIVNRSLVRRITPCGGEKWQY